MIAQRARVCHVVLLASLLVACARSTAAPQAPVASEPCEAASLPAWVGSQREPRARSTALARAPRETVHIAPAPEVDPVDRVLSRHGGRRRIRNLSLRNAPLDDTLRMFARMGRFNVVMGDDVKGRAVTVELRSVALSSAFKAVLASAKMEARVVADDILEVRPAGARSADDP